MYNPGVGAYSVTEILHLAGTFEAFHIPSTPMLRHHRLGLPVDLTLGDLLRSPSRICRYLLALYQFLYEGRFRVWCVYSVVLGKLLTVLVSRPELVRPCVNNNLLGGTIDQRLRYPNYLRVWAKSTFWTSERHYQAILVHNAAGAVSP